MRMTAPLVLLALTAACDRRQVDAPLAPVAVAAPVTVPAATAPLPPGHPEVPAAKSETLPAQDPHGQAAAAEPGHGGMAALAPRPQVEVGDFAPADRTIADAVAHRQDLAGKPLEVRGRVTKANHGILGRTWLHLRDPSGAVDLVVTTTDAAQAGDLVRAKGLVAIDKDVGAGYVYGILVEDATVVVEVAAAPR